MKAKTTNTKIEIIGWYGPLAIITAFALVSFGVIEARSYVFQLLNLTGALSILAISLSKKVYQSVALNGFMALIALITLLQLLFA